MKFEVINVKTGKVVRPYNYHFVMTQDGELYQVNHDRTYTKAPKKLQIVFENQIQLAKVVMRQAEKLNAHKK